MKTAAWVLVAMLGLLALIVALSFMAALTGNAAEPPGRSPGMVWWVVSDAYCRPAVDVIEGTPTPTALRNRHGGVIVYGIDELDVTAQEATWRFFRSREACESKLTTETAVERKNFLNALQGKAK